MKLAEVLCVVAVLVVLICLLSWLMRTLIKPATDKLQEEGLQGVVEDVWHGEKGKPMAGTSPVETGVAYGFAAGYGAEVTEDFECCIRDDDTEREIRFVADEDEQRRLKVSHANGHDLFGIWMEIIAARYGK